jgi:hypothetical protein
VTGTWDLEKQVPSDWVFVDQSRLKVFGLQYKALYSNGEDHWLLDRTQHDTLQTYPLDLLLRERDDWPSAKGKSASGRADLRLRYSLPTATA